MDPNYRLLRLISLVAYSDHENNRCGLRLRSEQTAHPLPGLPGQLGVMAHEMCMYYSGAVQHHVTKDDAYHRDVIELPDFTLPFVTNLTDQAEKLIGEILIYTLGLFDKTEPRTLARRWADDVTATCWDIKLAAHPDRFGLNS